MDTQTSHTVTRPVLTHPYVPARQAASVIMLRQAGSGLETFVQHRATTMDFAAGAVVFPGGRTDPEDADFDFGDQVRPVLAQHSIGWQKTSLGAARLEQAHRNASMMLRTGLREVEEETGVDLLPGVMRPWANLITPVGYPKRFDTFFYVAVVNDDIMPENITTEATFADWHRITDILTDADAQRIALMSPTRYLLEGIVELGSLQALALRDVVVEPIRGL